MVAICTAFFVVYTDLVQENDVSPALLSTHQKCSSYGTRLSVMYNSKSQNKDLSCILSNVFCFSRQLCLYCPCCFVVPTPRISDPPRLFRLEMMIRVTFHTLGAHEGVHMLLRFWKRKKKISKYKVIPK